MKYEFATKCRKYREILHSKRFLSVDPSSGGSSNPGWAIYEAGILKKSGEITLDKKIPVQIRLASITEALYNICDGQTPEILVIEKIRGNRVHSHLHWSVGAILSAVPAPVVLECPVKSWQQICPAGYQKTDESDAIMIGKAALMTSVK